MPWVSGAGRCVPELVVTCRRSRRSDAEVLTDGVELWRGRNRHRHHKMRAVSYKSLVWSALGEGTVRGEPVNGSLCTGIIHSEGCLLLNSSLFDRSVRILLTSNQTLSTVVHRSVTARSLTQRLLQRPRMRKCRYRIALRTVGTTQLDLGLGMVVLL